ncbi:m-aaa protease afg3 yta10-like protein, partial [Nannochloropsis gaditana CCMP526]
MYRASLRAARQGGAFCLRSSRIGATLSMRTFPSVPSSHSPSFTTLVERLWSRVPKGFGQFYPKEGGSASEEANGKGGDGARKEDKGDGPHANQQQQQHQKGGGG